MTGTLAVRDSVRTPRPHRGAEDAEEDDTEVRGGKAVVPYSSPESGFRGYTYEVSEALKDLEKQREVKGGLMGPLRAVAELERAQEQRNEAFRAWLSNVMKKEREAAKHAAITVLKRRDQMLQEVGPDWFQQLSWDQMETVNQLQGLHRADADEGATSRVALWCCRLGISPIPSARQITRALREQPEDHEAFLLALYAVISQSGKVPVPGDPPAPKLRTGFEYTPSERLLLSALAHLRLPNVIAKLEEQFGPPEKKPRYLRVNPDVPPRTARPEPYLWPYLEPLPVPRLDWLEVMSANHTVHVENLYMRAHLLPSTLIKELQYKSQPRPVIPPASKPTLRPVRSRKKRTAAAEKKSKEDEPAGASPRVDAQGLGLPRVVLLLHPGCSGSATRCSPVSAAASAEAVAKEAKYVWALQENDFFPPLRFQSFLESLASEDPLCQLPDVCRIPAIQKWIRLRNGLLYVHRRLDEVLQDRSLTMYNANHLGMAYRVPTPKHGLSPKQVRELTWDKRDWYRRRVDKIMRGYYTALRTIQVNASREMFPAMACDYFPARDRFIKTYFAYMPKHEMDVPVVKPWNAGEFNQEVLPRWRDRYYQCRQQK
ncbi:uncharacterized protein LOC117643357 [Thrips palmi]|uniref:Uncharacterized protein LOC117643357 n=1 Tax=Thrips palmi TaxID=161013 RepID=A0A6P8YLV1_THRPL|nr:uncharacterized protein LOC117643357 [Thrips palmi]